MDGSIFITVGKPQVYQEQKSQEDIVENILKTAKNISEKTKYEPTTLILSPNGIKAYEKAIGSKVVWD